MAVLTKNTDIAIKDIDRVIEVFSAPAKPSKEAFDRVQRAKMSPLFRNGHHEKTN